MALYHTPTEEHPTRETNSLATSYHLLTHAWVATLTQTVVTAGPRTASALIPR
jgi:hypothetical protein